jgi:hypothetical protein
MANKDNASFNERQFSAKFANKDYYFELCLFNNIGDVIYLKKSVLVSLIIEDNFFNPYHNATMIINDDNNLLEKGEFPYTFLGNGRDILSIKIIPVMSGNFEKDINNKDLQKFMQLFFQFVVVDSSQLLYNNMVCRKLVLMEYGEYALSESICNIFGIQKPTGVSNYMNTNAGNSIPTGDAIKQILEEVFGKDDLYFKDEETGETIFDMAGNESLIISPFGLVSYMDILRYVLEFHSHEESPCVLQSERFSKKYELCSLKRLFSEHDKRVYESIYFPNQTKANGNKPIINWNISDVSYAESRIIKSYIESPAAKYNINYSANGGIMCTSKATKSMIFDLQTLNSDNFTKKYYDLFVKPFENLFTDYKIDVNFELSPNNVENYNTHKGNLPQLLEEKKFLNEKLKTLLFLNGPTYQFRLEGLTHRQAVTFIDVLKNSDNPDINNPTQWDYNNLGRHLITSVKHIFTQDTYINEIETIKPYALKPKDKNNQNISEFLTNPISKSIDENIQKANNSAQNINDKISKTYNEMKSYRELGEKIQKEIDNKPKIQDENAREIFYKNQKNKLDQYKSEFKKLLGNPNMTDDEAKEGMKNLIKSPLYRTYPWVYLF